jgi:oligopeptide transport system substrate-binding protein
VVAVSLKKFSRLLQLTAEDELVPDVAQSWEVLDGGLTYIFHLRDDVRWSDGEPVTAADFEYTWKRGLHPDHDQSQAEDLFDIKGARAFRQGQTKDPDEIGVQAVDDHTLLVELEGPSSYFLQIMATAITRPVPKHVVERFGIDWTEPEKIVTNGPFILKSLILDQSLVLERYQDYHGRYKGNVSQIDLKVIRGSAALEMYEADELDILHPYDHTSPKEGRRFTHRHPDDFISLPSASTRFLGFDVTRPPFDDLRVRQALILATDREALANRWLQGLEFPAGGGYVPPEIPGHISGIALPYDPALARQKMAEAGYPKSQRWPPIEGLCYAPGFSLQMFEYLTALWKKNLGIQVAFQSLSVDELDDRLEHDPPNLWTIRWLADYRDPDSFLRASGLQRQGGWRHERYEALVEEARGITDQGQRMGLYRQAEEILVKQAPILPLSYGRSHVLVKPWLPGLPTSVINGIILKDIVIEPH